MYLEKINGPADVKALNSPDAQSWRQKCAPR